MIASRCTRLYPPAPERLRVCLGKHELRIPVGELGCKWSVVSSAASAANGHERNGQCRATHK